MSANGISTLATKEAKQKAKLDLAQLKRKGYTLYIDGTANFGSAQFSGSNYLSVSNAAFTFTGNFTVEGWYYPTNVTGSHSLFCLGPDPANRYVFALSGTSVSSNLYGFGSTNYTSTVPINTWTHIAVVRSGSTVSVYINGTASATTDTQAGTIGNGTLNIGADAANGALFVGKISNFRVVKGTAVYTQTFTPPLSPLTAIDGTQLLLNTAVGAGFLTDISVNGFTLTNTGSVASSASGPGPDTSAPFYRIGNEYDITELPTQYTGNSLTDHINETGLIYGRPWVQFLPSDLFSAGEEGAWFDPGDIATLFQDTAGTVPVTTAGQSVALMKDKSGRSHNATQATAGYRPTWQIDPYGYGYLLFDGVNDYMVTGNIDLTGTAQVTASVGLLVDTTNRAAGIRKTTYTGYWANSPTFFNTATSTGNTVATNFTIASEPSTTSEQYFGTFLADYTGTWTFTITSDDESALWIGDTAGFGYTIANASAVASYSGPGTATINMVAGQYYLIRVMYGNGPSTGSLNVTYAHTGQSATNDFTGKLFYDPAGGAISTGTDVTSVNGTFLIGAPSSTADHSFYLRGTSTIQARVQNVVSGDDILTGVFDISQATKELELVPRLSGTVETDISWLGTNAGTGNFGNRPLYIGAIGGSATYFKGNIYGIVVRGALSNNTQLTATEAWINRKLD